MNVRFCCSSCIAGIQILSNTWLRQDMLKHRHKTYFCMDYGDSGNAGFRSLFCKKRLYQSAISPSFLGHYQWLKELIIQDSDIHLFPPASPLFDSVYICLSVWFCFFLIFSALPGPAEARDRRVDFGALSQAASQGNYLELAGHLMRFTMIYAAVCTENRSRDLHIGLLQINSTL